MSGPFLLPGFHVHLEASARPRRWAALWTDGLRPLLDSLEAQPTVRVWLHLTGPALERLHRTEGALPRLRSLVELGRVEVVGGSWADSLLFAVPDRDAIDQTTLLSRAIESCLGTTPRGAWLAGGCWDAELPRLLRRLGLRYTFLPDVAFPGAPHGQSLDGPWVTEREGAALALLPLDLRLAPRLERIGPAALLQGLDGDARRMVAWAHDLEALAQRPPGEGLAPWVGRLVQALGDSTLRLRCLLPATLLQRVDPVGRAYLAGWWSADFGPFGAEPWDANMARYTEVDRLHKRMLRASREVARVAARRRREPSPPDLRRRHEHAVRQLAVGSASGPLWHGPGAGVYDPELRRAAYAALVDAERTSRRALGLSEELRAEVADHDGDGREEVVVLTPHACAVVSPHRGGALLELDAWDLPGNLLDTCTRHAEPVHDDPVLRPSLPLLLPEDTLPPETTDDAPAFVLLDDETDEPTDLPQRAPLADEVQVDRASRLSFVDRFLGDGTTPENLWRAQHPEHGDFADGAYALLAAEPFGDAFVEVVLAREGEVQMGTRSGLEPRLVRVEKRLRLHRDAPLVEARYEVQNRTHRPVRATFAVELNPGWGGAPGRLEVSRRPLFLGAPGAVDGVDKVLALDATGRLRMAFSVSSPARLLHYPVTTVVGTRSGIRAIVQGHCLVFAWDLELWGHELAERTVSVGWEVVGEGATAHEAPSAT